MFLLKTKEIFDWICIMMIIFGSLGNLLGLIVFLSRKFRRTTYGRLAIGSLIINLLCVFRYSILLHSETRRWITMKVGQTWFYCKLYRFSSCLRILSAFLTVLWTYERYSYVTTTNKFFSRNHWKIKLKLFLMIFFSLLLITILTGPTIYFYETKLIKDFHLIDEIKSENLSLNYQKNLNFEKLNSSKMICGLKDSISLSWKNFLTNVRFGFNYTTLRSIISEIIPSIFVIYFNIGLIFRVIQSSLTIQSTRSHENSFQNKDLISDGLIVHNRPRTSWMNLVLIIHSCLFCFSSLTATIVHWTTSDVLLSYWSSVVILANCSFNFYVYCLSGKSFRNEIRKLFQIYFEMKFLNLFRTKSQQEQIRMEIFLQNQTRK